MHFYKPQIVLGLLLLATVAGGTARSQEMANIDTLQSWLASIETMEGGFVQRMVSNGGDVLSESRGRMSLSRPGLFRWHYTTPSELLVVSDGQRIYNYDVELENVTILSHQQAVSGSPIALLTGEKALADSFEVGGSWQSEDLVWAELRPRVAEGDFRVIRLALRGQSLAAMELHDQLGQVTRVEFTEVVRNQPVDPGNFRFQVPEGVDVIEGGEMKP